MKVNVVLLGVVNATTRREYSDYNRGCVWCFLFRSQLILGLGFSVRTGVAYAQLRGMVCSLVRIANDKEYRFKVRQYFAVGRPGVLPCSAYHCTCFVVGPFAEWHMT